MLCASLAMATGRVFSGLVRCEDGRCSVGAGGLNSGIDRVGILHLDRDGNARVH